MLEGTPSMLVSLALSQLTALALAHPPLRCAATPTHMWTQAKLERGNQYKSVLNASGL